MPQFLEKINQKKYSRAKKKKKKKNCSPQKSNLPPQSPAQIYTLNYPQLRAFCHFFFLSCNSWENNQGEMIKQFLFSLLFSNEHFILAKLQGVTEEGGVRVSAGGVCPSDPLDGSSEDCRIPSSVALSLLFISSIILSTSGIEGR